VIFSLLPAKLFLPGPPSASEIPNISPRKDLIEEIYF
jgi:hypothetical protein